MTRSYFIIILGALVLLAFNYSIAQCPVSYTADFSDTDGGSPSCDANVWEYEDGVDFSAGGNCLDFTGTDCDLVKYSEPYSLSCDFCVSFDFVTDAGVTSDGIALSMVDMGPNSNDVCQEFFGCGVGGNIGYNNIAANNAGGGGVLTVEYDVFDNSAFGDADEDPDGNYCEHVAIVEDSNNDTYESYGCATDIGDGNSHTTSICWNPTCQELIVRVDGEIVTTLCGDIATDYFGGSGTEVNFVLSSGYNGSFAGQNQVCNFDVSPMASTTCELSASCTPLSVRQGSFKAKQVENTVELKWNESADEITAYEIEKSVDGKTFERLATINARENNSEYKFYDANPSEGRNYYRIKQIEFTDLYVYSDVKVVNYKAKSDLKVDQLGSTIRISNSNREEYKINVFDLNGKLLSSYFAIGNSEVDLSDKRNGMYFINAVSSSEIVSKKILIVNE